MIVLRTHRVYSLFRDDKKFVFDMPLFLHHNLPFLEYDIKYNMQDGAVRLHCAALRAVPYKV